MILVASIVLLLISFYLLAIVCDRYFVDSLDRIAKKLKMNSDMAGATFMAVGSSAPELFVSLIALFKPGNEALGAGTIVGSAIFNILIIIGASAMVKNAVIAWQPVIRDVIFYSASIILLLFFFRDGQIVLLEAIIFVIVYLLYVVAVMNWRRLLPYQDEEIEAAKEKTLASSSVSATQAVRKSINRGLDFIFPRAEKYWLVFFVSIAAIAGLSWVLVESAVVIAEILHIPAVIIGLTVLAAGTSIPDLISSIVVARQGRGGMAISNAVGSNIFDILFCLGFPWIITIIVYGKNIPVVTENLNSSILLLFATVVATLFLLLLKKWRIGRMSGLVLIGLYIAYLVYMVLQLV